MFILYLLYPQWLYSLLDFEINLSIYISPGWEIKMVARPQVSPLLYAHTIKYELICHKTLYSD